MSYNILIVDDSSLTRVAIKRIIDMVDVDAKDILEACNGVEALDVLSKNDVDLVLADLNMPEMGGVELIQKMKESDNLAGIPVIVVSTESSTTRVKELVEDGIKDFLHKPFTPEEFRVILAKNLAVSE
ncbi:MAG TPA: response regulator [Phycisphaerales bacterium]|nr:response regulator [Phycisphaerales bacterium]